MVRDADSRCPRDHCLSQNTFAKIQTQGSIAKEFKPKKSRPKKAKPVNDKPSVLSWSNEAVKLNCQEKKKEYCKKNQDQKNSTSTTKDNTIEDCDKKKKGDEKCYNCLKKDDFARNCLKPSKNKCQSWQPLCW